MNRYSDLREIGGGTFGVVYEATDTHKGEKVAIKRIKQAFASWKECLSLREVASLTKIPKHPHIVRLRQLILENKCLNFVFEYLPNDLLRLMRAHKGPVPEPTVRRVMWQLLQGLHHMHRHGFFHRDLKPENLLCAGESLEAVDIKICDLGQAREVRSRPPYTEYVSTRWYRSPEILLRSRHYNSPADMWAAGVVMAELLSGRPVFPGTSEVNQLYLIMDVVGPPAHDSWSEGARLMAAQGLTLPRGTGLGAASLAPDASPAAKQLLVDLLAINPQRRVTASVALASDWFTGMPASPALDDDETAKALMTPELGVGVSPVGVPGGSGLRSRLFERSAFDEDGGSSHDATDKARGGRMGGDRLSPVPPMSAEEAAAESGVTANLSVDTDNIEALLGSLGQGAVV